MSKEIRDFWNFTDHQLTALKAARDKGGAIYGKGRKSSMGGAYRRMCERLAALGLVEDQPPFPLTDVGHEVLYNVLRRGS